MCLDHLSHWFPLFVVPVDKFDVPENHVFMIYAMGKCCTLFRLNIRLQGVLVLLCDVCVDCDSFLWRLETLNSPADSLQLLYWCRVTWCVDLACTLQTIFCFLARFPPDTWFQWSCILGEWEGEKTEVPVFRGGGFIIL